MTFWLTFPFPHPRSHLPVWRSERGGGHHQPERHEPVLSAPALGPHLLLRTRPAGLGPEGLGWQGGERQGLPGGVHQESSGKEVEQDGNGRWACDWQGYILTMIKPQAEPAGEHVGTTRGNCRGSVVEFKCSQGCLQVILSLIHCWLLDLIHP